MARRICFRKGTSAVASGDPGCSSYRLQRFPLADTEVLRAAMNTMDRGTDLWPVRKFFGWRRFQIAAGNADHPCDASSWGKLNLSRHDHCLFVKRPDNTFGDRIKQDINGIPRKAFPRISDQFDGQIRCSERPETFNRKIKTTAHSERFSTPPFIATVSRPPQSFGCFRRACWANAKEKVVPCHC